MPNADTQARFDELSKENAHLRAEVRDLQDRLTRANAEIRKANKWVREREAADAEAEAAANFQRVLEMDAEAAAKRAENPYRLNRSESAALSRAFRR